MFNRYFVVGFGRLGKAITRQLIEKQLPITAIYNRSVSKSPLTDSIPFYTDLLSFKSQLLPGDCVFITVPDQFIFEISSILDAEELTLLHCSGATNLFHGNACKSGVFYPLMTFPNESTPMNWETIPVFLESDNSDTIIKLQSFATEFGHKEVYHINSAERLKIHLSAVLANNMIQALFAAASNYLDNSHLPSNVLIPIVKQMVSKWGSSDPIKSLTGPMVRGDFNTIQKHELLLKDHPELLAVYQSINLLIQKMRADLHSH